MRFLVTADWQLGMTAHFLPEEARNRYQQDRIDAVRRIMVLAEQQGADAIVVGGDVFDSNQLHRRVVARTFDALSQSSVPVWLVPGNHDPLDASSIFTSSDFEQRCPSHVHVVDTLGPVEIAPGVDLVAAPWHTKFPDEDLVAAALDTVEPDRDRVRLLVGHGGLLDFNDDHPALVDKTNLLDAVRDGVVDAAVLGDRHSFTEVGPGVWYPGTPEVTRSREDDPGKVLILDIDAGTHEVRASEHQVGVWKFAELRWNVDTDEDIDALERQLDTGYDNKTRTTIRLVLTGTVTIAQKARLDALIEEQSLTFALVRLWERHTDLAVVLGDDDFSHLGFSGFAEEALTELTEKLEGEDAVVARDALGLLHRLAGGMA